MKGMQKIVRGDNFRGVLDYAFDRDKNEEKAEGVLVGGNMSGTNAKELTAEFLRFADKRKDIKKPVWHNSLRVPEGDTLTDDEWNKIGFDYMERMGYDPKLNQFVFIRHEDKEGQHIHIIGSRIDMLGNVWLGRNENIISTRIISELERDHNLTQTKNLEYTKDEQGNYHIAERSPGRGRTLSRAEELMQNRKQWADADYLAPKQRLANAVNAALENQPTTEQFINALESENIQVQCVVKKGQMVGFSFAMNGENFKGSQVGANWKDITNERKLNYEHERDAEIIASRRYGTSSKQDTGVQSTPGADAKPVKQPRKQRAVADIGNLERDSRGRFIPSSQPEIAPGRDRSNIENIEFKPSEAIEINSQSNHEHAGTGQPDLQITDDSWSIGRSVSSGSEPLPSLRPTSSKSRTTELERETRKPETSSTAAASTATNEASKTIDFISVNDLEDYRQYARALHYNDLEEPELTIRNGLLKDLKDANSGPWIDEGLAVIHTQKTNVLELENNADIVGLKEAMIKNHIRVNFGNGTSYENSLGVLVDRHRAKQEPTYVPSNDGPER